MLALLASLRSNMLGMIIWVVIYKYAAPMALGIAGRQAVGVE
jgi:hypothetical protein